MENEVQPFSKIKKVIALYKGELQKKESEIETLGQQITVLIKDKEEVLAVSSVKDETIASYQLQITELTQEQTALTEKLENLGIDNADKAKTIKDLKGQISDLTLAKEKEERTLKIVRTEKAELVQDFDVKVK